MALINISLDSNYVHQELYVLPVPPSNFTFEELFTIVTPTNCTATNGSLTIKNSIYDIFFNYQLYKDGVLIASSNTGVFTGLTNGIYSVKFIAQIPYYSDYMTEFYIISSDLTGHSVTVTSFNNLLNHIVVRNSGKLVVTASPTPTSITIYDEDLNIVATGTSSAQYGGICSGKFYIKIADGSCTAYYMRYIKTEGLFSISGVKRVLYNINPAAYKVNYDTNVNYIRGILLDSNGTAVTSWREYKDFDDVTSKINQQITQNGSTKEFNQTLTLNIGKHVTYGNAYTEFIRPENIEFAFLIQDANDNWWYLGETTRMRLTKASIEQGQNATFSLDLQSFQKTQLRQVAPSYINTLTIANTVSKYCGFAQNGIAKMWIGTKTSDITYKLAITNNQIFVQGVSGITFTRYVVNSAVASFAVEMEKDKEGQNYRTMIKAGWGYMGDPNQDADLYDEDESIDYLYENELYVLIEDNNGLQWFFGKNNEVKLTDLTKATGEENGYNITLETVDNSLYFANHLL